MGGQNWKGNWVIGQGQGRLEVQGNPGQRGSLAHLICPKPRLRVAEKGTGPHQVLEKCSHLTGEDGQVQEASGQLVTVLGQVAVA